MDAATPPADPSPPPPRWLKALVGVLVGAIVFASASAIVSWRAEDQLYEPDILLAAFEDLPNDPARAEALATWIADEAISSLRLEEQLGELLPPGLGIAAGPLVDALESITVDAATRLVQTDVFAEIWADALPAVHEQFVLLAQGSDESLLDLEGQSLTIDLDETILATYGLIADAIPDIPGDSLFARITGIDNGEIEDAIGAFLVRTLPEDLTGFVLIDAEEVESIQQWEGRLQLIVWLSIVTVIAAAAVAIWLASNRPVVVAMAAVAVVVGAVAGILVVTAVENAIVDALRELPWDGDGPSINAVLNAWTGLAGVVLLTVVGVAIGGFTKRGRPASASHVAG